MASERASRGVAIAWHAGPRKRLRELFALAEDSRRRLAAALQEGRAWSPQTAESWWDASSS